MKLLGSLLMLAIATVTLRAEAMPRVVRSWEGEFVLDSDAVTVRIQQKAPIKLWFYRLHTGSEGVVVGFSDSEGKLLLAPTPANQGIQPIYREYFVFGTSEIAVVYDVQGNGGRTIVESFRYDGTHFFRVSAWQYGGRHDPIWHQEK